MGKRQIYRISLILTLQFLSVKSQGYGNVEDDSAAPSANNQQQQISSLPQYDPDPESYAQAPAPAPAPSNNLQGNQGPSQDQSQAQDFWWNNQPAFQKPAGHPGVEPSGGGGAPAPQSQQNNRAPNAYNPPASQQNNFQQSRPQPQQQPYKPQPTPSRTPYNQPTSPGSGWNGPNSAGQAPASNSLAQPANNFQSSQPFAAPAPECQLLNKADCHKRAPQQAQIPQEPEQDQGYNVPQSAPLPPQNYRPPAPSVPRPQPVPQRNPPQQQAQAPPGFYQPPPPQPYDSQPQNPPGNSNQNYQPQFSSESQPQSSSFPQSGQRPRPQIQPYRPPAPQQQQQQQYNSPAPQQQYQNNGQYNAPQSAAQPNQYYQSQPQQQQQQQQPIGQPVIGPIDDQAPFPGCPAAMLCVQDDQCNLIGVIEDNLRLSFADKGHRVALSKCSEPSTGIHGVCCRDPNYKDPWPDMNGGGNSGQYQPHHHDKGNHHDKGHQQQAAEPQGSFRNPYAEFGDRKKKSPSVNPSRGNNAPNSSSLYNDNKGSGSGDINKYTPTPTDPTSIEEPEFTPCQQDESCIIHYRCGNRNENVPRKNCKEDIFRNAYHCCKPTPSQPSHTTATTTTPTTTTFRPTPPTYDEPSIFTIATRRPLPPTRIPQNLNPNHSVLSALSPNPTLGSIYKNNPFLTDTFPPEDYSDSSITPTTPTISTTHNSLITGLGLRFHSHLHSKSALEANQHKPNPYIDPETGFTEPAIFDVENSTTPTTTASATTPSFSTKGHSSSGKGESTNSITEPLSESSNHRLTNSTQKFQDVEMSTIPPLNSTTELPENYTEVYEPPANRTREILQNFWNVDNYLSNSTDEKKVGEKVGSRFLPPVPVPLKEVFMEHPPPGFIFKEYDLYIPESIVPPGFFLPPKFEYGERQYPIPEDFPANNITTTISPSGDEDGTTILPEGTNTEEGISSQEIKSLL